jgi:hypothetical protein
MTSDDPKPAVPDDVDEELGELSDTLQEPHDDDAERAQRRKAAEEAASNPRRDGL